MATVADRSGNNPTDRKYAGPNRFMPSSSIAAATPLYPGEMIIASDTGVRYIGIGTSAGSWGKAPSPSGLNVSVAVAAGQNSPVNAGPINFTVTFSKVATGFTNADILFTGSTVGGTLAAAVTGTGPYNVAVTGMTGNGIVQISVVAASATDPTGAPFPASGPANVTFDTTAPSVTINSTAGQADPTAVALVSFTAVFSEAVTGFTSADISFTGSTATGTLVAAVSGGPSTYNVTVTGMTGAGTVVVSIPASAATDLAGNASAASTSTDNTVTFTVSSGGGTASIAYQSSVRDGGTDGTAYSLAFTGASAAGQERLVAVTGISNAHPTDMAFSNVVIDGQAATAVGSHSRLSGPDGAGNGPVAAFFRAPGTASTSFNITFNVNFAPFDVRLHLWSLTNAGTLLDTGAANFITTATSLSLDLDTVVGGVVAAVILAYNSATRGTTWTGLTERLDNDTEYTNDWGSVADLAAGSASTPLTVTAGLPGDITNGAGVGLAVSFNPGSGGGGTATGWTTFTATAPTGEGSAFVGAGTRQIFVSSSGSDANPGTQASPKATIAGGYALLRDGKPDWLLFKKGDTFVGSFGEFELHGPSSAAPMLVGAYGTGARPLFKVPKTDTFIFFIRGGVNGDNVAIVGLEIYSYQRNPADPAYTTTPTAEVLGIRSLNPMSWFLIEDCKVHFFSDNIDMQSEGMGTIILNRNVIVDAYDASGAHAQGFFGVGMQDLRLIENVFDHNGWHATVPGAERTVFNHNWYIDHDIGADYIGPLTGPATIIGNISTNDSAGCQTRTGGTIAKNLFWSDPVESTNFVDQYQMFFTDNVVGDCAGGVNLINSTHRTGSYQSTCTGNIFTHGGGNNAINLQDSPINITITGNVVYIWGAGIVGGGTGVTTTGNDIDLAGTNTNSGGTAPSEPFTAPNRDVGAYYGSIGGSPATLAGFLTAARAQSKDTWNDALMAKPVINYIRAGFGKSAIT